ncbi:MAG: spheroidene monooxygenase, partial [Bacillota bacterium]
QMAFARFGLMKTNGLAFWKLLGTGKGLGFSLEPDLNRYALLCSWKTKSDAERFFRSSALFLSFSMHAEKILTISMLPVSSHGKWSGTNPFEINSFKANSFNDQSEMPVTGPVAVLTRAAIRMTKLHRFWHYVPSAGSSLKQAQGLIFSSGIGEAPVFRQATFSVWRSLGDMEKYAYAADAHKEIIKRTRKENWYKEELFARFKITSVEGSLNGADKLKGILL